MFNPKPPNDAGFSWPIQCIWLKLNGSWPLQSTAHAKTWFDFGYNMWSLYIIVNLSATIIYEVAFLILNFYDIMMTTENCCTTFMGTFNLIRLVHMRINRNKFREILQQFVNDIWINETHNPQISQQCKKEMIKFRIISILLCGLIFMYCVTPLIILFSDMGWDSPEKPFPYKMVFPYNANYGWRYILTYAHTSHAGLAVVTTLFGQDSLFGIFIIYTCGQFRMLYQRIDNLVKQANIIINKTSRNEHDIQLYYNNSLNRIAQDHYKLIKFSEKLEHFFNPMLLVNFFMSSVLICMVGFQLATNKSMFIGDYMKFILYILSSLSQLFILCWTADSLIQHSFKIVEHLYACNWEGEYNMSTSTKSKFPNAVNNYYPTNKKFRKTLQIMIMCCQRPIQITAFKFSVVSLPSFTTILSTSMSYFTLLQSIYTKDN